MSARLYALPERHDGEIASDEPADFEAYLFELGLARSTIGYYVRMMLRADAWCEQHGHRLAAVPGPILAEFAESLPRSRSTRHHLRASLAHFWVWQGRHRPPLWAIKVPRARQMLCRALEPDAAALLARSATERGDRQCLAVLVGLYQAFRVSEIAGVRWEDIGRDGWIAVVGKGDVAAKIPLHPRMAAAFVAHRARYGSDGPWVFPGRYGGHIHPASVWGWVKAVADEIGIANLTTHQLRHTALAEALDATHDLRAVRDFARHAKVSTTEGYTRTTVERLMAVSAALRYGEDPVPTLEARTSAPPSGLARWLLVHGASDG